VFSIRPREPGDLPGLCDVLAAQAPSSGYPIRWPWSAPVEEFIVRRNEEMAWTAVLDAEPSQPVGHVAVERVVDAGDGIATGWMEATGLPADRLGCIAVLFVDQDHRGLGVGQALIDTAVSWLGERGRQPVLDVVSVHDRVIDLYHRGGWRTVGLAHPPWLPEADLVLMVLDAG
jgi:GNAT superfamily N-acetyltransferase